MPIYEYQCPSCGVTFEKQQSITANPIKTCPECGGRKVQRLISNTSFVLKGSGWYVTDYGKGGSGTKDKDKAKDTSTKSESSASASTSDTKASTSSEKSASPKPAAASS